MLSAVLGSGMSSRLFLEVRERRGLAYYVHGMNHSYTDAGSLLAQAGVDIKRIDEAIKVIVEQFARMADEPVGVRGAREVARDDQGPVRPPHRGPAGPAHVRAQPRGARGGGARAGGALKKIDAVTAEDVQRVAQDLIDQEKLHLAVIGPFEDDERFANLLR